MVKGAIVRVVATVAFVEFRHEASFEHAIVLLIAAQMNNLMKVVRKKGLVVVMVEARSS
jgi:hypothetical protein